MHCDSRRAVRPGAQRTAPQAAARFGMAPFPPASPPLDGLRRRTDAPRASILMKLSNSNLAIKYTRIPTKNQGRGSLISPLGGGQFLEKAIKIPGPPERTRGEGRRPYPILLMSSAAVIPLCRTHQYAFSKWRMSKPLCKQRRISQVRGIRFLSSIRKKRFSSALRISSSGNPSISSIEIEC